MAHITNDILKVQMTFWRIVSYTTLGRFRNSKVNDNISKVASNSNRYCEKKRLFPDREKILYNSGKREI
jgi:hypothetical protein